MRKILFALIFLLFFVWLFAGTENRVVALTVVVKGKTDAQITEIKNEFQKVADRYGLKVSEIPLGDLIEKKMQSIK